jgi:hypothetical protein
MIVIYVTMGIEHDKRNRPYKSIHGHDMMKM